MARQRWRPKVSDVLKMDVADIDSITDIGKMRDIVRALADAGNKRLKRMEKLDNPSPAYLSVVSGKEGRGKFRTAGMDLEQLKNEYKRARSFLTAKTSTVSGWKKHVKQQTKKIQIVLGEDDDAGSPETDEGFDEGFYFKVMRIMSELENSPRGRQLTRNMKPSDLIRLVSDYVEAHPQYGVGESARGILDQLESEYEETMSRDMGDPDEGDYTDVPGI